MSLLGRFRAALGRDNASLLDRARKDLRMGLSLHPPACHPPLNRAIAALERLPQSTEVALMLGQGLRAKAEASQGKMARNLRARAVAKLRAALEPSRLPKEDQATLWTALSDAWLPLASDATDPELTHRQLLRAQEALELALALPTAGRHLAMAEVALAQCQHPLCPTPAAKARLAQEQALTALHFAPDADQTHRAHALVSAVRHLFPGLASDDTP